MTKRIYNKFETYVLEDCDCSFCIYGNTRKKNCKLDNCAIAEEKAVAFFNAMKKLKEKNNGNQDK